MTGLELWAPVVIFTMLNGDTLEADLAGQYKSDQRCNKVLSLEVGSMIRENNKTHFFKHIEGKCVRVAGSRGSIGKRR